MSQQMSYTIATVLIIAMGLYIMYGGVMSPQNIDFVKYQEVCEQYKSAAKGAYKDEEVEMLVTKVNYILPKNVDEISDPAQKKLKSCAQELARRLESEGKK